MRNFHSILISNFKYLFIFQCLSSFFAEGDKNNLKFFDLKEYHTPIHISDNEMRNISAFTNMTRFNDVLSNIMIIRDVGSPGHDKVKKYLVDYMKDLQWTVEENEFKQFIPYLSKTLTFTNVVAKLNNAASRYLVFACHYDSKLMKNFLGATDSAVPCAMLLDMATALNDVLHKYRSTDLSVMFIFFDGEEAFYNWSPSDSIYGARHLAKTWESTSFQRDGANHLQRMDVLVLLDLLGAQNPTFYYYNYETKHLHNTLTRIQNKLRGLNELKNYSNDRKYFVNFKSDKMIEDDHLPFAFAKTPVPILHIIPDPFPDVWHTLGDNMNALDFNVIDNLNKIFRVFTMSYLEGSFDEQKYERKANKPLTPSASITTFYKPSSFPSVQISAPYSTLEQAYATLLDMLENV